MKNQSSTWGLELGFEKHQFLISEVAVGDGDAGENFEFGLSPSSGEGESGGEGVNLEMQAAVLDING